MLRITYDYVTRKGNAHRMETNLYVPASIGACAAFEVLNHLNARGGNRFVMVSIAREARNA